MRGSTKQTGKREAQKYHDELKRVLSERDSGGFSLADALRLWLQASDRSKNEKQAIKRLLLVYPSRPIGEVGTGLSEAIAGTAGTRNRTISIVNAALAMARKRGVVCPPNIPKLKVTATKLRFLTKEEWTRLDAELSGHVKHIVRFALYTGLRASNVFNLKWSEVNLETKTVWVDASEAKGKKSISIPLSADAYSVLAEMENREAYVFTFNGKPVKSVKTAFGKALKRAGIEDFRFHDLRHTWASWHVQKGTPLMVLKELGGWADISMVQRYAHLSPEHLRQWV